MAGEERLGDGPGNLGDPGGTDFQNRLDDHGRLPRLVFPVEEGGGKLIERF